MNDRSEFKLGRYQVLRTLGVGNLGRVYLARDDAQDRDVAIKMFDPPQLGHLSRETAERLFVSEARAAAQLDHPNIATIYEVVHEVGKPYVVMESVYNGRSLARHCESSVHRLPLEDAVRIARSCANALHHAHQRGVVHRDVKPRNVLLDEALEPKLVDFGFSVITNLIRNTLKAGHGGNGFNPYAAPERNADKRVGIGADIYSLGIVLYELLAGRPPFQTGHSLQNLDDEPGAAKHTPVRRCRSDVPRVLEMITDRCLNRVPSDRYPTALHFAANLEVAADQLQVNASPETKRSVFKRLSKLPLFKELSESDLNELVSNSTLRVFRDGDEIITAGDTARCIYVIVQGEAGVRRDGPQLVHLGPGEYFGEVGALCSVPRTAPVIALDKCSLLAIPMAFIDNGPPTFQLAFKTRLLTDLASRLVAADTGVC